MASTKITRTFGTPTSTKIGTFSFWMKLSDTNNNGIITNFGDANNRAILYIASSQLQFYDAAAGDNPYSSRKLRDLNAWYHIVLRIDTTQGTAADRCRIYINGEQESLTNTAYVQNENSYMFNSNTPLTIGRDESSGAGSDYFNGSLSHFYYCDGQSYAPTVFGSTDSTTGEWKINTSPSVTYGNQGFLILKDGNSVTDQSGQSNNWTVAGGTLTNTEDCPSNVFATMNSLDNYWSTSTYANGNNTVTSANNGYSYSTSTLGVNTGKFYWECKWSAQPTGSTNQVLIGIAKRPAPSSTTWLGSVAYTYGYQGSDGHVKVSGGNATGSSATTYAVGDIISVALDLDNNKLHFAKNGSWTNSSNPSANSGGITITAPDSSSEDSGFYFAAFGDGNASLQETGQFNFGNGYFGTTAVASAGTNASGNGIFEFDVPSGFTALSTKGLNL